MKLPGFCRVLGTRFAIFEVDSFMDADQLGEYSPSRLSLGVLRGLADRPKIRTLLHEFFHAGFQQAYPAGSRITEEQAATLFESLAHDLIVNNRELVEFAQESE